jgi:hypothetical protein
LRALSALQKVYWSPSGELVVIACEGSYYVLKFANQTVARLVESGAPIPDDGIEEAFEVICEISETWVYPLVFESTRNFAANGDTNLCPVFCSHSVNG